MYSAVKSIILATQPPTRVQSFLVIHQVRGRVRRPHYFAHVLLSSKVLLPPSPSRESERRKEMSWQTLTLNVIIERAVIFLISFQQSVGVMTGKIFELNETIPSETGIRRDQFSRSFRENRYRWTTACMNSSRNSSYSFPVVRFCRRPI